jgi:hypothetical protein
MKTLWLCQVVVSRGFHLERFYVDDSQTLIDIQAEKLKLQKEALEKYGGKVKNVRAWNINALVEDLGYKFTLTEEQEDKHD